MEFPRAYGQMVFPIFYDLNPSEIRKQESRFGETFRSLIQRISATEDDVSRWRTSLIEACSIPGFVMPDFASK